MADANPVSAGRPVAERVAENSGGNHEFTMIRCSKCKAKFVKEGKRPCPSCGGKGLK